MIKDVADLVIVSEKLEWIEAVKLQLHQRYKMIDLGHLKYMLGIKVSYSIKAGTILLYQEAYCKVSTNSKHIEIKQISLYKGPVQERSFWGQLRKH